MPYDSMDLIEIEICRHTKTQYSQLQIYRMLQTYQEMDKLHYNFRGTDILSYCGLRRTTITKRLQTYITKFQFKIVFSNTDGVYRVLNNTYEFLYRYQLDTQFFNINYIKLSSSTCFERHPLIFRRSMMLIVHVCSLWCSHSLQVAVLCTC